METAKSYYQKEIFERALNTRKLHRFCGDTSNEIF
jgi:hypothetical protein